MECKPVIGHYTGAGDELDVEDLYTKYKVKKFDIGKKIGKKINKKIFFLLILYLLIYINIFN